MEKIWWLPHVWTYLVSWTVFGTQVCETRVSIENRVSQTRFTLGFIWRGIKKKKKKLCGTYTRVPFKKKKNLPTKNSNFLDSSSKREK